MAEDIVSRLVLQGQQYFSTINQAHQRTQKFQKDTQQGFKNVSSAIQAATKFLVAFGAAAVARQINRLITDTARLGDELAKMSQRTGLTVEFLNGFVQTAGVADVEAQSLAVGIRTLNKNLLDMTQGTGEAKDSFEAMGISADDAAQLLKTPEASLLKILDLLSRIPDASRRGAVAQELLGRAGTDWLPLINQGTDAIKRQIAEFQKLRPITAEQAKAAEEYNDSMTALTFAFEGFLQKGLGPVLPPLTQFVKLMTELVALDTDTLGFRLATVAQDLRTSLAFMAELLGNPLDYAATIKKYEEIDKKFVEERRKRFAGPEAFTPDADTLPTVTVNEQKKSAELQSLINLREARIQLIEAEEAGQEIKSDRVHILQEEIALLQEAYTIQKEIEAANTAGKERAVDETVILTAKLEKEATLKEIQSKRVALLEKLNSEEQEILGIDIQHGLNIEHQAQQQAILNQYTKEQREIERAIAQAGDDTAQVRGGQILLIQSRINFLKKQNELLGETAERNEQIRQLILDTNALRKEGHAIEQKSLGQGLVRGASADIERQLSDKQRAVRDAEQQLQLGSIARGQTIEQQRTREIQLIDAKLALLQEEQRLGLISTEQADNQTEILVTQFSNASNPRGFLEGWQDAFKQFSNDAEGAFGLAQTLARQFTTGIQTITSSIFQNVFDKLEEGTLSWKSALDTIPNILQQITSQLIGMAIAQGVASAIGGGLGGFFGGGAPGATPNATARGALNPNLFGPGFASGGSFMVGGPSGTDRTPVSFMASRGERVTVETPDQQRRGGLTINFFDQAGVNVQQQERQTASGSALDVFITRRVRRINRDDFGLPPKPGRVG